MQYLVRAFLAALVLSATACGGDEGGPLGADPILLHGNVPSFGSALAVSGSLVVIGSSDHRRVETFVKVPQGFDVQDGSDLDRFSDVGQNGTFGDVLALDGDRLAVAGSRSTMPTPNQERFVEVLHREGSAWITEATFTSALLGGEQDPSFGRALSLDGDQLAIGAAARDRVYLLTRTQNGAWGAQIISGPAASSGFGAAVAFVGAQLAVGAPGADDGVAYLYDRAGPTEPSDMLQATGEVRPQGFGDRIAASGSRVVIGAPYSSSPGEDQLSTARGAIFVFESRPAGWRELSAGPLPSLGRDDHFGDSIAIQGDQIVIGAPNTNGGSADAIVPQSGAVYLAVINGDGYQVGERIDGPPDRQGAHFGAAVAVSEAGAFLGAPGAGIVEFRAW